MRLLFILTGFLALCFYGTLANKNDAFIQSATPIDTALGIIIQNSLPKGSKYTDPAGKVFSYAVFWTRVINATDTALKLSIRFPDTFTGRTPYPLKLFLLPLDTMTLAKESSYDYGVTGLPSFLDTSFNNPTVLKKNIDPEKECVFYVIAVA